MSNKYSQKLLNNAKKFTTDAIKTASKRVVILKTAEASGDLVDNKIADEITSASKKLHSKTDENEINIPKERYISPEKRRQFIDELKLV